MDFATIVGIVGSFALILISILIGGDIGGFIDIPSIIIVIGGGFTTCIASMSFPAFFNGLTGVLKTIFVPNVDGKVLVGQIVELATVARRDGILALENHLNDKVNSFLSSGIRMAVDGTDPELIEKLMHAELESMQARHRNCRTFLELYGKYAPAYGMIGTLVGLVIMLANLSDPDAIGPGMAVALLTTLYGAILANVVCLPLVDKLSYYSRQEIHVRNMIIQGVMAIQSGDNPRIVEQKLNAFLAPKQRTSK